MLKQKINRTFFTIVGISVIGILSSILAIIFTYNKGYLNLFSAILLLVILSALIFDLYLLQKLDYFTKKYMRNKYNT